MLYDLAARMRSGETLVGTWLYLNDAGVGEIVAAAGFDFVVIDMEHSPTGYQSLRSLLMSIEHHTAPVVRVKGNAPEFISAILDLGPAGVMVPRVQTAEQARRAVQYCKYHPLGERGFGPIRVSDYGRQLRQLLPPPPSSAKLVSLGAPHSVPLRGWTTICSTACPSLR